MLEKFVNWLSPYTERVIMAGMVLSLGYLAVASSLYMTMAAEVAKPTPPADAVVVLQQKQISVFDKSELAYSTTTSSSYTEPTIVPTARSASISLNVSRESASGPASIELKVCKNAEEAASLKTSVHRKQSNQSQRARISLEVSKTSC